MRAFRAARTSTAAMSSSNSSSNFSRAAACQSSTTDVGASSSVTADSLEPPQSHPHTKHHSSASRSNTPARTSTTPQTLDTTMQNAIESLTQDDAESALVFALVHDAEFRLATAIASHPTDVDANVVRALLFVFESYEDQLRKLVGLLMVHEMVDTHNWNELFRANSTTTAIIREYTCELGMDFLQHAFAAELALLWDMPFAYEVNPQLLVDATDDLERNQQQLEALADRLLDNICMSAHLFPYQVAKIYRVLESEMLRLLDRDAHDRTSSNSLSAIAAIQTSRTSDESQRKSTTSLPRLSAIGEDASSSSNSSSSSSDDVSPSTAREEFAMHLGGLVFLRFICPALVLPHKMHLAPDGVAPSKPLQRTLVLVAKLFQSLANNVEYDATREAFMVPFNGFLQRNRLQLLRFYDQICQQATSDTRRESLIAQSHITPRISQVWPTSGAFATASSSVCGSRSSSNGGNGGRETLVNLTDAATVASGPDECFATLRQWIQAHLEFLTLAVAKERTVRRRTSCGTSGSTSNSRVIVQTTTTTTKQIKPKRKLKSSKSSAPSPPNSNTSNTQTAADAAVAVQENDDALERKTTHNHSHSSSSSSLLTHSAAPLSSGSVSRQELALVMGHTSHRDIQLMRLYYSKLSQKGLQRLMAAVDPAAAHTWFAYKCKHHVDVFRRDPNAAAATRRSLCLRVGNMSVNAASSAASPKRSTTDKSRFVEMKASVVVRATPRRVFQYLRSLENVTEWDEYAATVQRVEPIDESRVVMYRSHPKLSLWPTWLVKPRDSCDLHSFVDKTGRFDTFAVVMESIHRPDVPEIKGTVRMANATGGFLVEPAFGEGTEVSHSADPSQGAFAKLTCVVRADFKGFLPRYLAESICYRQVLRIVAIRGKIEATASARAPTDSAWI